MASIQEIESKQWKSTEELEEKLLELNTDAARLKVGILRAKMGKIVSSRLAFSSCLNPQIVSEALNYWSLLLSHKTAEAISKLGQLYERIASQTTTNQPQLMSNEEEEEELEGNSCKSKPIFESVQISAESPEIAISEACKKALEPLLIKIHSENEANLLKQEINSILNSAVYKFKAIKYSERFCNTLGNDVWVSECKRLLNCLTITSVDISPTQSYEPTRNYHIKIKFHNNSKNSSSSSISSISSSSDSSDSSIIIEFSFENGMLNKKEFSKHIQLILAEQKPNINTQQWQFIVGSFPDIPLVNHYRAPGRSRAPDLEFQATSGLVSKVLGIDANVFPLHVFLEFVWNVTGAYDLLGESFMSFFSSSHIGCPPYCTHLKII